MSKYLYIAIDLMSLRHLAQKAAVFDAFPKVEADNQTRSEKGGLLTLILTCFLLFLTFGEYSEYRKLQTGYQFKVDSTIDQSLKINMDFTVAMPCPVLMVHVYDVSGQRMHLTEELKMVPAEFSVGTATKYRAAKDPKYIKEIINAAKGKPYDEQVARDMGACRIYGSIQANKVAANLHVTAAGHGYHGSTHTDHSVLNFTHRIDEFSFGEFYPNLVNPLDNSVEISDSHFEVLQYLISVVPTTYFDVDGNMVLTNQYAVTDSRKAYAEEEGPRVVPGIFFKYDIEPISVVIHEYHSSFFGFLVRLCGIIGGSVVTVGFIYRTIKFCWTGGKDDDPHLYAPVHNLMRRV
ncbi:endoplasmic reticulum vesicle transporter-domain-containing protein [Halteromyces radiatus]|uniref:endoplasmic reticulum vesicle transporter-domain-containing protein n=1 Tax=Halteromyces radiatus TaxID=101107 RepID=UPI00221F54BA|nr:endoplasmic reticulum vesicle transporter-domain-containing protein [Halteromyces radiatus]KAI8084769.1 endoplasmic reticulum vesicle transporter-domain-containing protein [Halteromyces radiatus]